MKDNDNYLRSFDPFSYSLFSVDDTYVIKSSILDHPLSAMHDIGARGPQPAAEPWPAAISAGCGPFFMPRTGTARPLLYLSRLRPAPARVFRSSESWIGDDT